MPDIKRTIKLITKQHIKPGQADAGPDGHPMRDWEVSIFFVGPNGDQLPATAFEKVTYNLHSSFESRQKQVKKQPPFTIKEEGWGEFDMDIVLTPVGASKGGEQAIKHDLTFAQERYEATHTVNFRNPKAELVKILSESGPVGEANGTSTTKPNKRKSTSRNVDMEKLAEALPQLQEDDLLQVVQMIHDNKTDDTYTKNDLDNGEFHVDLYTLPDNLIKMLWDFTSNKVDLSALA